MTSEIRGATETCELLGIARSTLQQWLDKGWIHGKQLSGGAWIFTDEEIARVRAERAAEAASA